MREGGNKCLRCLQLFFNFFLILFGFALIGLGIYVWYFIMILLIRYYTRVSNFIDITFFVIGSLQILIGFVGNYIIENFKAINSAKSKAKITCYIFILGLILLV